MPQFYEYENNGRKLKIEFTCYRCKKVRCEDLEPLAGSEGYGYLHNIDKPKGWTDYLIGSRLLCDTCTAELEEFFQNKR